MMTINRTQMLANLAAIQADTWNTLTIKLIKEDFAESPATAIGDLTFADFSGYAEIAGEDMFGPVVNDSGQFELISGNIQFKHNGGGTQNTIYGFAVVDAAEAVLFGLEKFADPQAMAVNGDVISFSFRLDLPQPTAEHTMSE